MWHQARRLLIVRSTKFEGDTMSESQFVHLNPATIKIGANVRTDLHPDATEFARSIKERGVLEPITVYRDEDGTYVVLRGQRRTVVAVQVGLAEIPAQVVPHPQEADRITDQMVENLHRASMRDSEIVGGVEQLALVGLSAAQIAKRAAVPSDQVNAALAIAGKEQTRSRVLTGDLTLVDAAIFAEFEHDDDAVNRLEHARECGRPLTHVAQQLRDEAEERADVLAEINRLRAEGLPVLDPDEITDVRRLRLANLVGAVDGESVPEDQWPGVPGAAVVLVTTWEYPTPDLPAEPDDGGESDGEGGDDEAMRVHRPMWICRDPEAAGLVERWTYLTRPRNADTPGASGDDVVNEEAAAEAAREERRRVIANNKAWASAEVVRRDWLRQFLARKTPPQGAEALICEAVVGGQFSLIKAMEAAHPLLRDLNGLDTGSVYGTGRESVHRLATTVTTAKAATMTTLAAVVTSWEASTGKHTWRHPSAWDARVLAALTAWGYEPSEVESLLRPPDDSPDDTADDSPGALPDESVAI